MRKHLDEEVEEILKARKMASHDYFRHGVTDLFAALNLATGQVIHQLRPQHRAEEFKRFLSAIDKVVPAPLNVHVGAGQLLDPQDTGYQQVAAAPPPFPLPLHALPARRG